MARSADDHDRLHYPHISSADLIGLVGIAALAFVVGRATSSGNDCSGRLQQAQMDLLLCQTSVGSGTTVGLAEAPGTL